jgi:tetratricopeptide (TPR) repeat protein
MSPSNVSLSSESPLLGPPQHGNAHATRPPLDERSLQQFAAWALAGLGEAEIQLGEPTYLERLLEAGRIAALLDDVDLMVRTAMSCFRGWTLTMGQPVENFISLLEKAVERTRGERTPRHAMLLARLGTELYWKDIEEGYQRGKEAVELARDIGDPTFFARVVATAIYGLITVDSWTEADHLLDEALEALGPRGDPTTRFMLLSNKALVCSQLLDDIAPLHDLARETESLSRRLRAPNFLWQQGIIRTAIELIDGDMEAAEEEAKRTFDMGIANSIPEASPIYVGQLTFIRFVQGRYHEVAEAIAQAASQVATIDAYALGAVQISLSAGMTEQAMQLMAPYLERPFDSYRRDHIWPLTMYLLTESLLLLEAVEPRVKKRFPEVVEVLRPHGELLAFTGSVAQESLNASVGKLLHSLGRFEESERYLLKALARHEGLRAPYITARTRIAMARLYKDWGRPGDKERSLALASQVLGVGLEKGYGGLVEEARSLLALLG